MIDSLRDGSREQFLGSIKSDTRILFAVTFFNGFGKNTCHPMKKILISRNICNKNKWIQLTPRTCLHQTRTMCLKNSSKYKQINKGPVEKPRRKIRLQKDKEEKNVKAPPTIIHKPPVVQEQRRDMWRGITEVTSVEQLKIIYFWRNRVDT